MGDLFQTRLGRNVARRPRTTQQPLFLSSYLEVFPLPIFGDRGEEERGALDRRSIGREESR